MANDDATASETKSVRELREVIVYWDYESSRPPKHASSHFVANEIRECLRRDGYQAIDKYAFTDVSRESTEKMKSLHHGGFDIISCRHPDGKKEEVDKRMMMKLLQHDRVMQKDIAFVVVTRDCDFCACMNTMRDLGRRVLFLCFGEATCVSSLVYAADEVVQLNVDDVERSGEHLPAPSALREPPDAAPRPKAEGSEPAKLTRAMFAAAENATKGADGSVLRSDLAILFYKFANCDGFSKVQKKKLYRETLSRLHASGECRPYREHSVVVSKP